MKKPCRYLPGIASLNRLTVKPVITAFFFLLIIIQPAQLQAQGLEIAPMAGYTLRTTFDVSDGEARILGGFTKGGAVTYNITSGFGVEVSYFHQQTDALTRSFSLQNDRVPLNIHHILAGGIKKFPLSEVVVPFTGINLGAVGFVPTENRYETGWRFALGAKAGTSIIFSDLISLRIQAMAHTPISGLGTSFFFSTSGSSIGVSSYGRVIQVAFMGGIALKVF